jgi:hypothetical protein
MNEVSRWLRVTYFKVLLKTETEDNEAPQSATNQTMNLCYVGCSFHHLQKRSFPFNGAVILQVVRVVCKLHPKQNINSTIRDKGPTFFLIL